MGGSHLFCPSRPRGGDAGLKTIYLRIGFYQPAIVNHPPKTFDQILTEFNALPDDETRTTDVRHEPIRVQKATKVQGLWRCDMMRLRMHEDLRRGRRDGKVEPIQFEDDEGLGENTAFAYHVPSNTVIVQEFRGGVSLGMFTRYFKVLGGVSRFELNSLLRPDAIERLARMPEHYSLEVHLADVKDAHAYRDRNLSARKIFEMISEFRAPKAKITIEIGRGRGRSGLPETLANIGRAVRGLLPNGPADPGEVKKLVVIGRTDDANVEAEDFINLLEDRLVEFVPIELEEGKRITDADRINAVITAWNIHRESIERYYLS